MNVSGDSNENRDGLGWLISVSFGASLVTGRISGGPPLDQSRERTQADTEVEASRGGVESRSDYQRHTVIWAAIVSKIHTIRCEHDAVFQVRNFV